MFFSFDFVFWENLLCLHTNGLTQYHPFIPPNIGHVNQSATAEREIFDRESEMENWFQGDGLPPNGDLFLVKCDV